MLYTTVLVAVAAFTGFASAQNSTIPCCTVPVNTVPDDQKTLWCQAERNTCPEICGGLGQIASGGNNCDDVSRSSNSAHTLMVANRLRRPP